MGENYFGITDPGRLRVNNEDRFIAQSFSDGHFVIASVIDGVGGYAGGEIAAQLTSDEIIRTLAKVKANIIAAVVTALDNANEKIIREKEINPQNDKMACVVTLAVVDIENNMFYFAHVGDTRLYLLRDGSLIKVTKDHSTVGYLEESGRLNEEDAMAHPKRNEVNKVLGYDKKIAAVKDFIDTGESPFLPGDTILLCSDGLTDMITSGQITAILKSDQGLAEKGRQLIAAANDAGGRDNITVVLVHNNKSPLLHAVTKPSFVPKKNNEAYEDVPGVVLKDKQDKYPERDKKIGTKNGSLLPFFVVLLLFIVGWEMFKMYQKRMESKKIVSIPVTKKRNLAESDFLDSINAAPNKTVRLVPGKNIIITDSIIINNDTLHIIGNGNSFTRDSAFAGPAFILSPACKFILFDSLVIENFETGALVLNKGLHLKHVQFKNCRVPLEFQQQFLQNVPVTGAQAETIFHYVDSVKR